VEEEAVVVDIVHPHIINTAAHLPLSSGTMLLRHHSMGKFSLIYLSGLRLSKRWGS
jgi:hypothetical protein